MSVEVHILARDEHEIIGYTLRHYKTFAERIVLHDAFSVDGTRDIAKMYGAEIRDFKTDGVNDILAKKLKEHCVAYCRSDWCIVVDADELIYFPGGAKETLAAYEAAGVAIVKPHGFELYSEVFPTTDGQIYDEVKIGAADQKWYAKPVLVRRAGIKTIEFSAGAHSASAQLANGQRWTDGPPTNPPTYMLHCKHLGPIERITARYARQQSRHSQTNIRNKFGNFEDPMKHAKDKRAMIIAGLRPIIP